MSVHEAHADDCEITVHLADDAMAAAYADQGETVPERECSCGLYDRIAARDSHPHPAPSAAEVLREAARQEGWIGTAEAAVAALELAGYEIRLAASPPAELSPVGLNAEDRVFVDYVRRSRFDWNLEHHFTRLLAIIDALLASPVGPQREGLAEKELRYWRRRAVVAEVALEIEREPNHAPAPPEGEG